MSLHCKQPQVLHGCSCFPRSGHIELIPISGCACENRKHYRPLDSNVVSYIRVAYIFKIIIIIHPYQALTFSPQNPDGLVDIVPKLAVGHWVCLA